MNPHQKHKPIRLTGKPLQDLYREVYRRDRCMCQVCSKWVEPGTTPHHVEYKSHGGGDTIDNLITLCYDCHAKAHSYDRVRRHCEEIMRGMYE